MAEVEENMFKFIISLLDATIQDGSMREYVWPLEL